jgi:DNA-binding NarL/FixJ family response regulator
MIRVLIVDDHTVVRFGLAAIISLQPDMTVAGEASSGEEACALCARSRPGPSTREESRPEGSGTSTRPPRRPGCRATARSS